MGKPSLAQRFWQKVRKTDFCWEWAGAVNPHGGHGRIANGSRDEYVHRVSWRIHNGTIPAGMNVLHRCDNPICVNPQHLFLGTHADNMLDRERKGRTFVPGVGKKLTDEEVQLIRKLASSVAGKVLAQRFGVSTAQISRVKTRTQRRLVP